VAPRRIMTTPRPSYRTPPLERYVGPAIAGLQMPSDRFVLVLNGWPDERPDVWLEQ
jgi:hypothetical protein